MTKYFTVKHCEELQRIHLKMLPHIRAFLHDCMNEGLDTDDIRTAKTKQHTATTASRAVVWDESGHLKQALISL